MTFPARKTLTIGLLIALLLWAVPAQAEAWGGLGDFLGIGKVATEAVLTIIRDLLNFVHSLLQMIIVGIGDILQAVVSLEMSTGGKPVYTVWRILRDFCNMAFIIVLIFMAFGTIFDSFSIPFLKAFSINSRGVIPGFLIAAFMLNFSLAIGQTVVATSNHLSGIVLKVFPTNIGASLVKAVDFSKTQIGTTTKPTVPVLLDNVPVEGLTDWQKAGLARVDQATRKKFTDCLQNNTDTALTCYQRIVFPVVFAQSAGAQAAIPQGFLNNLTFSVPETIGWLSGAGAVSGPKVENWELFTMIVTKLWLIFLSVIFVLSLTLVLVFMLVRIPAIWVLLALSPLAWTSKAFPGTSAFGEWWKQFMAWNIFSPLYLFVLYLGVLMIQKTSQLPGSLATVDGTVPMITGFLGELFGYGMVGIVFIGGTMQALKMSFAGGSYAKDLVDKVSGGLGMSGKFGAAAPAARFIKRLTGADTLKATAVARGQKLAQVGRGWAERNQFAQIVKPTSYEEKLASMRGRMGVAGGAKEFTELKKGQVDAAMKNLGDLTAGMKKEDKIGYLRGRMNNPDRNVALAAREELLKLNALDEDGIKTTREMYGRVGAGAQKAFDDRARSAPGAAAIEKKKEEETARAQFIAGIAGKIKGDSNDSAVVKGQLDPVFAKLATTPPGDKRRALLKDLKAAEEAIGGKDPMLLKEYLDARNVTAPGSEANVEARAFGPVIKDPNRMMELPPEYLTTGNAKMGALKAAIDNTYTTTQAKAKLRDRLLRVDPTRLNEIKALTT